MPGGGISRCRRSNGRGLVERIRFQWHAVDRWTRGRDDVEGGATTVEDGESLSEPHLLYDFLQALPQLFGADGLRHCDTPFQVRPKIITPEADGLAEGRRAEPRGRHLRSGTWRYARRRSLQTVSRRCRPLAPLACWRRAWRLGAAASVPYRRADQFQWNPVDRLIPGLIEAAACPRAGRRFNEAGAGSPRNTRRPPARRCRRSWCFNEAGAGSPRNTGSTGRGSTPAQSGFNEAGAGSPRNTRRAALMAKAKPKALQ